MSWWQGLLFPCAVIYDLITRFRNHLYNIEYKKSFAFETNVISVGNLSVGGTGKTPMVDFLIDHFLQKNKSVATLSRGYGRKTKGFRICSSDDSAQTIGDESFTYFEKYGNKIMVTVGEDRAMAIPFILVEEPELDVILLDDAYQHRTVRPNFSILLTTHARPFWSDHLLPSGRLRESKIGAERADVIVVTKSKSQQGFPELEKSNQPYFQTTVKYAEPVIFFGNSMERKVLAVGGLADNRPFFEYLENHFDVVKKISYADHHTYSESDMDTMFPYLNNDVTLITTHKDAVKLREFEKLRKFNCAYIPIKVSFLKDEERFLQMVNKSLKDYKLNP